MWEWERAAFDELVADTGSFFVERGWWLGLRVVGSLRFPGDNSLCFWFAAEEGFADFDQVLFAEPVDDGGVDLEFCRGGLGDGLFFGGEIGGEAGLVAGEAVSRFAAAQASCGVASRARDRD